uniref:PHD finger protein 20 like 1 n=1 Tax=Scleropages formosus TaxID=113540 RepID=A0A8C9RJH4_SCLFO
MSKKPPNRPGITFEVGAKIEAQDYLHKWYPSHIEKIDYEEGKMLVHFDRWSHRYDEWIYWDSSRLRPLQRPALRKEGLKEEDEMVDLRSGEEVLARWTDCRYYPAKIESISKEGSYTVQFYDGVVRCVKRMHIKSMLDDSKGQVRILSELHVIQANGAQLIACSHVGKKKDKERKDKKDHFKVKQKKKKKKKKSKQHNLSDFEDLPLSLLERCSSPCRPFTPQGNASSKLTAFQYPRAILSVDLTGENLSDIDFLEDSSTESLFLSGDEYGQDLDSFTMDDFQEEDNEEQGASREIVRCICEMDDENGFMIQCEECMCWQHSVCVGLLEDCVPDLYICYMCRDPPGQRWSAKYQHSKEWLNKGHMYGLPFLSENYSHQNAKKIVSTHQLLADVFSVKKVLHGLQLKMDILQRKHSPSLHLWARSWVKSDEDKTMVNCPNHILIQGQLSDGRSCYPSLDNYITSEHSYQKPLGLGLDPWSSTISEGRSNWEPAVPFGLKEEKVTHHPFLAQLQGLLWSGQRVMFQELYTVDSSGQGRSCLQLQLNLLNHVEDVQKQVARRMDLIEKELDVLENWLDFTGELEPPDPLARLPQLKWRMKQLLNDLVKVQQMGSLFSI